MLVTRVRQRLRDAVGIKSRGTGRHEHLRATMDWLCRAQDAVVDGGVARSYSLRWQRAHGRRGWLAAYPETTGYIIPTFFDYAARVGHEIYRERAIRMARWEIDVQMASGAVQGGVIGFPPTPAVFNTGQVLFGWVRAFAETGDERYRVALGRAAEFLVSVQDADGAWRAHGSRYARTGVNVYDARSAWGLLEASRVTRDPSHREAAIRNLKFTLTKQRDNGWFEECCLDDDARPLLHTIAYTMEGLLEAGVILGESAFVEAARRAADALVARQRPDGALAGRFDAHWNPIGRWSCLTGDAQTAIVWLRLFRLTDRDSYFRAASRLLDYLCATQDLSAPDPGVRGGVKGSDPIWAEYGSDEYLNWAAKFLADALILDEAARTASGDRPA
jgi:hypothetical protein